MSAWRRHVPHVRLEGLEIQIPPDDDHDTVEERPRSTSGTHFFKGPQVVVDQLVADDAKLVIIPRDRSRLHRTWVMHRLRVRNVSVDTAMPFESTLTNAVPPGEIRHDGHVRPVAPRRSRPHADRGRLHVRERRPRRVQRHLGHPRRRQGTYTGHRSRRIRVDRRNRHAGVHGQRQRPRGAADSASIDATVDGTNGNTTLDRIDAHVPEDVARATGGVYDVEGVKGRDVTLDVESTKGRLEDVMRLAVKTPTAADDRRPAAQHEASRSRPARWTWSTNCGWTGRFTIDGGRFTNADVQQKINELSHRASGKKPRAQAASRSAGGRLRLQRALQARGRRDRCSEADLRRPGRDRRADGQLPPEAETLNFAGNLYMDAKVSQTVSGWKSLLLKMVDPLFRKTGTPWFRSRSRDAQTSRSSGSTPSRVF